MILRSPAENKDTDFVMPAWIAGIQVRKDAFGDIHVDLDSSNPCWNDCIEGRCFNLSYTSLATFLNEVTKTKKDVIFDLKLRDFHALRGEIAFVF